CLAFALYFYLAPIHGSVHAAWITAAAYFGVAVILALIARQRLAGGSSEVRQAGLATPPGGQADMASLMAQVVREELPKHAVPATLVALVGGLAAGLNPTAAQNLARD